MQSIYDDDEEDDDNHEDADDDENDDNEDKEDETATTRPQSSSGGNQLDTMVYMVHQYMENMVHMVDGTLVHGTMQPTRLKSIASPQLLPHSLPPSASSSSAPPRIYECNNKNFWQ